jgi:RecA-family ATPase
MADSQDFVRLIEPVARLLLGEPNEHLSTKGRELRFGSRGSMSVDLEKATYFDNETNTGGGFLDLVALKTGTKGKDIFEWLDQKGFHIERDEHHRGNGAAQPSSSPKLGKIVKTYDYTDEAGALLFQVVRFEPKDFRQRKPDKSDPTGWSWKIKGVRQVPYRLNDVIEAVATEKVVYIVEGEKDADNLWDIGVPATTNAGGCGKWRRELSDFFHDADVVIIQDNDPQTIDKQTGKPLFHEDGRPKLPGQDHAQQVARDLFDVAHRVRVLDLAKRWTDMPLKGDVSDWIKAGGTTEALSNIAELVPDWSPDIAPEAPAEKPAPKPLVTIDVEPWDHTPAPKRQWAVEDMVPASNVSLVAGEGGVGKTLIMQQLAIATVAGMDWLGTMPARGPVIFLTAEDDEDELHFRYEKIVQHYDAIAKANGESVTFAGLKRDGLHILSLAGKDAVLAGFNGRKNKVDPTELYWQLYESARIIRPRWIGIDTAADVFTVEERDRSQVRQCISLLRKIALDFNTAVILLSHPSLSGIASGTGMSGSTAWNNSVRSRLYLKKLRADDPDDDVRVLEVMKANYAKSGEQLHLEWRDGLLRPLKPLTPLEKQVGEANAKRIFVELLKKWNDADKPVSPKPNSPNNFGPNVFARQAASNLLHSKETERKRMFLYAMQQLLDDNEISIALGPLSRPKSKRNECLYAVKSLPLEGGKNK